MKVECDTYMDYENSNYGVNALRIDLGDLTIWFSYRTPIAFQYGLEDLVIRENDWSNTTGKHLNTINIVKSNRISGVEFEEKLNTLLQRLKLQL